jgi:hypothetical protein
MSSSNVPCEMAYGLATATVTFTSIAVVLAVTSFSLYSWTLHKNPNQRFSNTTKYDVESSTWVLVLSAIGALCGGLSVISNHCGPHCPATTLACNTLSGQYGASMIAAFSAVCAATLKICSYFHQMNLTKKGENKVNDNDQ